MATMAAMDQLQESMTAFARDLGDYVTASHGDLVEAVGMCDAILEREVEEYFECPDGRPIDDAVNHMVSWIICDDWWMYPSFDGSLGLMRLDAFVNGALRRAGVRLAHGFTSTGLFDAGFDRPRFPDFEMHKRDLGLPYDLDGARRRSAAAVSVRLCPVY